MKKFLTIIFSLAVTAVFSQDTTAVSDTAALQLKTKVELTDIYLEEVNRVVNKITLIAFDSLYADVPDTDYTKKKLHNVTAVENKYNEKVIENYNVIIPYADKAKIVEAILYLRSIK